MLPASAGGGRTVLPDEACDGPALSEDGGWPVLLDGTEDRSSLVDEA